MITATTPVVATGGTKTSFWINLAIGFGGLLAGTDWTPVAGGKTALVAGGVALLNAVLHAITGNAPMVSSKS